ncbi:PREDICTED: ribosomal RNA-processing protein 8 isoform X2 [Rhagoletis zephyria]|uniref:ribosomal RNA-processing protein 8 isoform X2 n=1 Tax=Rhagoletis zephyria TaxID=28612 RepID=UPI000811411D|nr:PREDICTED: ribosomal RNA-processing protein 8 isoform X2 [Rhagoletis zephyria]XP_036332912.1 ribosomal RNA-processing protein 8 isoform X2 [Rhagoletis pomonella]
MMPKFFVPTSWENLADAMKFRSKVSLNGVKDAVGDGSPVQTNLHKKLKRVNGNLITSSKAGSFDKAKGKRHLCKPEKVQNGRITKPNSVKNLKHSKVKITPAPSLALPVSSTSATKIKSTVTAKRRKRKHQSETREKKALQVSVAKSSSSLEASNSENEKVALASLHDIGLKVFENSLKQQLLGGRFRYINEQLYTMDSAKAEEFFKSDVDAFDAYHTGYQLQVEKWPMNPLDRIIKVIKRLPKALEIVDFGCGEGRLAKSVPNKVYSMDLVSTRDDIIACDMAHTPLSNQSVDIAVYCLSLMGTNLKDYLLEANRVLRPNGLVIIAEIQSRFDDLRQFIRGTKRGQSRFDTSIFA